MASSSALAVAVNVFTAPGEAFAAIKERPRILFPLLLVLCGIAVVQVLYIRGVSFEWLLDQQLKAGNAALTDAQRAQAVTAAAKIPPTVYAAIAAFTTSLFFMLVTALGALYYTGVSFVTGDGVKFKQWFSLICWCMLPLLLGILAQIVRLLTVDVRFLPQDDINPLAFGTLLSIDRTGVTMVQRILLSFDFTIIWTTVLSVLGYQAWTKSSIVKAAGIVLGPLALIIVGASVFALFSAP